MSLDKYSSKIAQRLSRAVLSGNIMHAYIFEGDRLSQKECIALDFFKAIACKAEPGIGCDVCSECRKLEAESYEDLYVISSNSKDETTKASIKVNDILGLQKALMKKPVGIAKRNFVIINDADLMTVEAQDKLLKTLEEPPEGSVIVLLCENSDNLLITIKSRCVKFYIASDSSNCQSIYYEVAQEVVRLAIEEEIFENQKKYIFKHINGKGDALMFFDAIEILMSEFIRDNSSKLMDRRQAIKAIDYIEECRRSLAGNCNYKYVLCSLILKIGG